MCFLQWILGFMRKLLLQSYTERKNYAFYLSYPISISISHMQHVVVMPLLEALGDTWDLLPQGTNCSQSTTTFSIYELTQ